MTKHSAKKGDNVKIHYTAKLEDGKVFDTSKKTQPIQFKIGGGTVIPALEKQIVGMEAGEHKNFIMKAQDAYGLHRKELIIDTPKEKLPPNLNLKEGQRIPVDLGKGGMTMALVLSIGEDSVVIDANHPLAGHDITFDIELLEIL